MRTGGDLCAPSLAGLALCLAEVPHQLDNGLETGLALAALSLLLCVFVVADRRRAAGDHDRPRVGGALTGASPTGSEARMARHVEPSPGRVNEHIAFACVGDAERCHEAHDPLAWACSVLVDDGDIKGSYVTRIERLPGGEIDWFRTQYGASEGLARDEMVEARRPLFSTAPRQRREDRVHVSG